MTLLFANGAASTLSAPVTLVSTTLVVATGEGDRFPAPGTGESFMAVIQNGSSMEIIEVTARSGDVFTISRGLDGTTAQSWVAGSAIDLRNNAETMRRMAQAADFLPVAGGAMEGQFKAQNSTSTTSPPVAFDGDENTGLARPAADTLALVAGGTVVLRVTPTTAEFETMAGFVPGNASQPGLYVVGDSNTGIFSPGANMLSIATGGGERVRFMDSLAVFYTPLNVEGITQLLLDGKVILATAPESGPLDAGVDIYGRVGVLTDLTVGGNAAIAGSADIDGALDVADNITARKNLAVTGTTTLTGGLSGTTASFSGAVGIIDATASNHPIALGQITSTLGASGKMTLPGGFELKWGTAVLTGGTKTVTFSDAFDSAAYVAFLAPVGNFLADGLIPKLAYDSLTASGFVVQGPSDTDYTFAWAAIGSNA